MMERTSISAIQRDENGTSAARRLRTAGYIPAVVYGRGKEVISIGVPKDQIIAALSAGAYTTHLFDLNIADAAPVTVMIMEVQRNPVTRKLLNIDFHAVSLTEKVHASVPIMLKGEPAGAKLGGIVERLHNEISVRCLPEQIPDHIDIDISGLNIGDAIHVRDLGLAEEVETDLSPDESIVMLTPPAKAIEEVKPTEEAEEGAEPEVIAQKGETEEE
jgi:large subunit ribosomal protein L25